MFTFAMLSIGFVMLSIAYEYIQEDSVSHLKELMEYERGIAFKRQVVIKGFFSKHNEQFKLKGPRGSA
jgi:hypothetical protein